MLSKISVATGTTPTAVIEKSRKWYLIQNQSDTDIFLALEGSSDVTVDTGEKPGFKLAPGASLDNEAVQRLRPYGSFDIYAVHSGASAKALAVQTF